MKPDTEDYGIPNPMETEAVDAFIKVYEERFPEAMVQADHQSLMFCMMAMILKKDATDFERIGKMAAAAAFRVIEKLGQMDRFNTQMDAALSKVESVP